MSRIAYGEIKADEILTGFAKIWMLTRNEEDRDDLYPSAFRLIKRKLPNETV
jgi:hypothetical protein